MYKDLTSLLNVCLAVIAFLLGCLAILHPPHWVGAIATIGFLISLGVFLCGGPARNEHKLWLTVDEWKANGDFIFFSKVAICCFWLLAVFHISDVIHPNRAKSGPSAQMIRPDGSWNVKWIPRYDGVEDRWFTVHHGWITDEFKKELDIQHEMYILSK